MHNEEAILSIVYVTFTDSRCFFEGMCAKEELLDTNRPRQKLRQLHVSLESIK